MEDLGQLRIFVSEDDFSLYQQINGNKFFNQNSEFFIFCALIGEKNSSRIPLENRAELCRAITMNETDKTVIKSIYYNQNQALSNAKEMIRFAEEYANGGLRYLVEGLLSEFVVRNSDNSYSLKPGDENDFFLTLTKFVLKEIQVVPF